MGGKKRLTNDEAINVLKNVAGIGAAWIGDEKQFYDLLDAVKMAVEALKRETSGDTISRQAAIDVIDYLLRHNDDAKRNGHSQVFINGMEDGYFRVRSDILSLPSVQPEYEPVKTEDFAKTMSENSLYSFMAWHGEALELMEREGFVICKKTS